jgi:hypothetical protein
MSAKKSPPVCDVIFGPKKDREKNNRRGRLSLVQTQEENSPPGKLGPSDGLTVSGNAGHALPLFISR